MNPVALPPGRAKLAKGAAAVWGAIGAAAESLLCISRIEE
jgi:hypothetical protein